MRVAARFVLPVIFLFVFLALLFTSINASAKVLQIAAGSQFSCALFDNNKVKCWGINDFGTLGIGSEDQLKPGTFSDITFGTNEKIIALKAHSYSFHACALFESGRLKCWGNNAFGQLGLGDAINRGDSPDQMGEKLPFVDFGKGFKVSQLALGSYRTCAILSPISEVKCYGYNEYGQLGYPSTDNQGVDPNQLGENLPFVDFGQRVESDQASILEILKAI